MIGSNVPTIGGIEHGFNVAQQWMCESIQIYTTLSRRWEVSNLSENKIYNFNKAWSESCVKEVVSHVPFLVNCATPDDDLYRKSKKRLRIEIENCSKLGIKYLVMHPGSYCNSSEHQGLERIISAIKDVADMLDHSNVILSLETMAGQGTQLGASFDQLAHIINNSKSSNIGICFDACHVFAAGYNLHSTNDYQSIFNYIDGLIGIEKLKVFHVNDSRTKCGSRVDRHSLLGEGEIGIDFFDRLVNDKRFNDVPMIVEPSDCKMFCKSEMELLRELRRQT